MPFSASNRQRSPYINRACLRFDEPQEAADQGRLAAAGRADQTHDLAFFHGQGKIFEDALFPIVEGNMVEPNIGHTFTS